MTPLYILFLSLSTGFSSFNLSDIPNFTSDHLDFILDKTPCLKPSYTIRHKNQPFLQNYKAKTTIQFDDLKTSLKSSIDPKNNKQLKLSTKLERGRYHFKVTTSLAENEKGKKIGKAEVEARFIFGN